MNADTNEVKIILVPEVDHDVNPAGVKGLGELANAGTAAAIANAVYHATGTRIRRLPIRIENLISACSVKSTAAAEFPRRNIARRVGARVGWSASSFHCFS